MRISIARSIRLATVGVLGLIGVPFASAQGSSCPASPAYSPDFSANQGCLTLNSKNDSGYSGSPSFVPPVSPQPSVSNVLRLTANEGGWATSAWYQAPQVVANGFTTTFSFQLGSTSAADDADGIAFVIQNSSLAARGPNGCGIGFGSGSNCTSGSGISNSVAIEFNTFNNGAGVDPSSSDVTIQNCGGISANSVDSRCSLKLNNLAGKILLADGALHVATIIYTPSAQSNCGNGTQTCSTLDVVLDGVDLFPGGVLFDISTIGLSGSSAWVGFTAATGGGNDDQDILSWTFTPQGQSQTGTITPGQTSPTTFKINGGFVEGSPTTGYDFTAQQTDTSQQLKMVVTVIPVTQQACNALVQKNQKFTSAQCFVYQNGAGQDKDAAVLFEVTCPPAGSCGSSADPFDAELGTNFNFFCTENVPSENAPLRCGVPPLPFSFGFPNLTSDNGLPSVGFLKGEGPDPVHPCTPDPNGTTPLFQGNQIDYFALGDTSGGAKGSSGGTTSCWVMTYLTQNELPTITITQPVGGANYSQGQTDATTLAKYSCSAVNAGAGSPTGPYLTVAACSATDTPGNTVASGSQFDTTALGPHTFTVDTQDSATNTNRQSVTYNVVVAPAISGPSSATFAVGSPGSVGISATGYPVPTLTESGILPPGVTFVDNKNGTGTLSGTATASGIFAISFTAQNGVGSPATLAFTLTVVSSVPASGTKCNGVYNGTFKGNIVVGPGQSCIFMGGGVTGSVTETGGSLVLRSAAVGGNIVVTGGSFSIGPPVTINGNFTMQSTPKSAVQNQVCGAAISGSLVVQLNGSPVLLGSGTSACPGNTISGNLSVSSNLSPTSIYSNIVGGSLVDVGNVQPTQVFSNQIKGLLSCSANSAITGGGNTATKKQGQCASF
jgi:Legume lectin domain